MFVHRLVAQYFCDGYAEGLVVNHIDGDKTNNRSSNLEWVTRSENDLHAFSLGLRRIIKPPPKKKWKIEVFNIGTGETIGIYENRLAFAIAYGRSEHSVQQMIARGYFYEKAKTHSGKCFGIKWYQRTINV